MTYEEAEQKVKENKHLIGKKFVDENGEEENQIIYKMLITPMEDWGNVSQEFFTNGGNNRLALSKLGVQNKQMNILLLANPKFGVMFHRDLEEQLTNTGR